MPPTQGGLRLRSARRFSRQRSRAAPARRCTTGTLPSCASERESFSGVPEQRAQTPLI